MSETAYELGAVIGTATLGTIFTAFYRNNVDLPRGLSAAQANDAGESIGGAVATRAIMADLRAGMNGPLGGSGGGPAPFRKEDRSRFLQALDRELVRLTRAQALRQR